MTTYNLNAEVDIGAWTQLGAEVAMSIANAPYYAFIDEADRLAWLVRYGFLTRTTAGDLLQQAADYNSLSFLYGQDRIQNIMASAMVAAAFCEAVS